MGEEQACKVGVETLITRDELVGECQSRHETTLLEPEDGGERSREEDTLDGSEGDQALGESRTLVRDPLEGPVGLLLDAGDGLDGVKEVGATGVVFDIGVDEEGVGLGVDVLPEGQRGLQSETDYRLVRSWAYFNARSQLTS